MPAMVFQRTPFCYQSWPWKIGNRLFLFARRGFYFQNLTKMMFLIQDCQRNWFFISNFSLAILSNFGGFSAALAPPRLFSWRAPFRLLSSRAPFHLVSSRAPSHLLSWGAPVPPPFLRSSFPCCFLRSSLPPPLLRSSCPTTFPQELLSTSFPEELLPTSFLVEFSFGFLH